jgi:glucosamine 6-phosphate synthetase-like amidotransferase/phosphosugar isomerase protein
MKKVVKRLLEASQIRGTDASGIAVVTDRKVALYKNRKAGGMVIHDPGYVQAINHVNQNFILRAVIGHTRLQTKGDYRLNVNNHPIVAGRIVGVHNGLISNDDRLFKEFGKWIDRAGKVDSEVIFRLLDYYISHGDSIVAAVEKTDGKLMGSYTCAFVDMENPRYVVLFRSGNSAVLWHFKSAKSFVFASSDSILDTALSDIGPFNPGLVDGKMEIKSSSGIRIDTETGKTHVFELARKYGTSQANECGYMYM